MHVVITYQRGACVPMRRPSGRKPSGGGRERAAAKFSPACTKTAVLLESLAGLLHGSAGLHLRTQVVTPVGTLFGMISMVHLTQRGFCARLGISNQIRNTMVHARCALSR